MGMINLRNCTVAYK